MTHAEVEEPAVGRVAQVEGEVAAQGAHGRRDEQARPHGHGQLAESQIARTLPDLPRVGKEREADAAQQRTSQLEARERKAAARRSAR